MAPFVWSDSDMKKSRSAADAVESRNEGAPSRLPYSQPQIEELGSLADLTRSIAAGFPNESGAGSIHAT